MKQGLSQVLGEFAASLQVADLPPAVIERVRLVVLHNLAVALAGWSLPLPTTAFTRHFPETPQGARLLVDGRKVCMSEAAFANACLMHIRTQDDFFSGANAHLGAVIIPAALAVAESTGASGRDVVAAIVAGYEVIAALGEGFSERVTPKGFRPTGIFGPFGAAATTGRLLGLTPERLGHAIAICASLAGGLTQPWLEGTPEWDLQVGVACRNGLMAALLAEEGMPGALHALEGPRGFYHAFAGEGTAPDSVNLCLGERWRILENTFKLFPVSGISQVPVRTALVLRGEHGLTAETIQGVDLTINNFERLYPGVDNPGPFGGSGSALMSLQYCLATALQKGSIVWRDLLEIQDPVRLALARQVRILGEPDRPALSCHMLVKTKDGRILEKSTRAASGLHFDRTEAVALVQSLAPEMCIGHRQIEHLIEASLQMDQLSSVKILIDCCIPY